MELKFYYHHQTAPEKSMCINNTEKCMIGFLSVIKIRTCRYLYRHQQYQHINISSADIWNPLIWKYRHIGNHQYRRIGKNVISARPYIKSIHVQVWKVYGFMHVLCISPISIEGGHRLTGTLKTGLAKHVKRALKPSKNSMPPFLTETSWDGGQKLERAWT